VRSGSFRNSRGMLADLVSLALLWVRREGQGCTFSPLSAVIVQAMVISLSHTHTLESLYPAVVCFEKKHLFVCLRNTLFGPLL